MINHKIKHKKQFENTFLKFEDDIYGTDQVIEAEKRKDGIDFFFKGKKINDYLAGSVTFGLGCIAFTIDAFKAKPVSKPIVVGCMLFNLGCCFFIKDALNQQ
jgi:hypothetical protein